VPFPYPSDIEAIVTFVPRDEGGRHSWVMPREVNYIPQFRYQGQSWDTIHEYPDVEYARPGDTVRALLRFLMPERQLGRLHVGMSFEVCEGGKVAAYGTVTKILALEQNARRDKIEGAT